MIPKSKLIALINLIIYFNVFSYGADYATNSSVSSNWTNAANWQTGGGFSGYPGCCNLNGSATDNFYINGKVTLNGAGTPLLTVSKGTLIVNDTLIVYGNLRIENNGDLEINDGAALIIYGDLSIANKVDIAANAYLIIKGDFIKTGSAGQGSFISNDSPSKVFIEGSIFTPGGFGTGPNGVLECNTAVVGTTHPNSTCNYGNGIDLENDPVNAFVNLLCEPKPNILFVNGNSPVSTGGTIILMAVGNAGTGGSYPINYQWAGPASYSLNGIAAIRNAATTDMTGYYLITVKNDNGCKTTDSIFIEVTNSTCCNGMTNGYVSKDNYTGNWEDATTWSTPNSTWRPLPPPTDGASTGFNQSLCINGYVTINGDYAITSGSQRICDTLVITGNLDVSTHNLEITSTGLLIVLGNTSATNGAINNNGNAVFVGEFDKPIDYNIGGGGNGYVFDDTPNTPGYIPTGDETTLENDNPDLFNFIVDLVCNGDMSGGTVAGNQSVCNGDDLATFINTALASPGTGYNYQWFLSTNSNNPETGVWNAVPGATNISYNHGAISTTSYFYRQATTDIGCMLNSNVVTATVLPSTAPTIAGVDSVCENSIHTYSTETGMSNYNWNASAGGSITNLGTSTDNSVEITWSGSNVQTVTVDYTDLNGCRTITSSFNVQISKIPNSGAIYLIFSY